jgi:hypothetical protein
LFLANSIIQIEKLKKKIQIPKEKMIPPTNFLSQNFFKLKLKVMSKIQKQENKIKHKKLSQSKHKIKKTKNKSINKKTTSYLTI